MPLRRSRCVVALLFASLLARPTSAEDVTRACILASEDGQRLRDEGKLLSARENLLRCADTRCPAVIRKDCGAWLTDVNERVPLILLAARSHDGTDLSDVRVFVDGKPFADTLSGRALEIDPGKHTFRFESPGASPVEQSAIIGEGEKHRVIRVEMGPEMRLTPPPVMKPLPSPRHEERGIPIGTYVSGAVGVLGIAGFAYFGATGQSQKNDLQETCAPTGTCSPDAVSEVRTKLLVADVSLGIGLVGLGLGLAWYFLLANSSTASARSSKSFLRPAAAPFAW